MCRCTGTGTGFMRDTARKRERDIGRPGYAASAASRNRNSIRTKALIEEQRTEWTTGADQTGPDESPREIQKERETRSRSRGHLFFTSLRNAEQEAHHVGVPEREASSDSFHFYDANYREPRELRRCRCRCRTCIASAPASIFLFFPVPFLFSYTLQLKAVLEPDCSCAKDFACYLADLRAAWLYEDQMPLLCYWLASSFLRHFCYLTDPKTRVRFLPFDRYFCFGLAEL